MTDRFRVLTAALMASTAAFGITDAASAQSSTAGNATASAVAPAADSSSPADSAGQEIIVTGFRQSLTTSANIKRNTMEIVDSINAEDIGKLPDPNVAATLTRIPGVQAYRFGGEAASPVGVGSGITIRGLSGQTAARIDGRAYFTAGGREFNIEGATPGIVAGLDVFKNPSAEHIEGAIGGLINIRTRKPLDFKDDTVANASATVHYNDLGKRASPEFSGLISHKWAAGDGEIGILIGGNYQRTFNRGDNNPANGGTSFRRVIRADSAEYAATTSLDRTYVGRSDVSFLADVPDITALSAADRATVISAVGETSPVNEEDYRRTRIGLNAAIQWKPSSTLEFTLSGLYNSYLYHQNYRFLGTQDSRYVQNLTTTPFTIDEILANRNINGGTNDVLTTARLATGTFLKSGLVSTGGDEHRKFQTGIVSFNSKWSPSDRLQVNFDVSFVKAKQYQDNRSVTLAPAAGLVWDITRNLTTKPHTVGITGADLSSASTWVYNQYANGINQNWNDKGLAAQLDLIYKFDSPVLKDLKFGVRYGSQSDSYHSYSFGGKNLTTNGLGLAADRSNAILVTTAQDLVQTAPTNIFNGAAGYSGGFLTFSPDSLLGDNVRSRFPNAGIFPSASLPENLLARRYFKEQTYGAYGMADFGFFNDRIRGNVGIRVVKTDVFTRAQVVNIATGGGANTIIPNEKTASYTNALPSLNLTWSLTNNTLVRFGYSKGITRPDPGSLNPVISVDLINGTGGIGNAALKPQKADSFDISLEHYFSPTNYVSANVFYKKINGFFSGISTCQTVPTAPAYTGAIANTCSNGQYLITQTVNAQKGFAKGIEIAGQTFFDYSFVPNFLKHFGAAASFTYVDTKNPIFLSGALVDTEQPFVSKNSYSLAGFYENGGISARLVYTYRSDFVLFGYSANPIDGRYVKGYGLLDASINFKLPANFSLSLNASNLTNAAPNRYVGEPGISTNVERQHFDNGRTFSATLRYSFGR
jgi:iron complex outermembrane receptor protein